MFERNCNIFQLSNIFKQFKPNDVNLPQKLNIVSIIKSYNL